MAEKKVTIKKVVKEEKIVKREDPAPEPEPKEPEPLFTYGGHDRR